MDENSSGDELTFHFIRDEPAETDSFGSHSRVATAIATVIAQNANLKVIGLLGPWGSGKSTVVRLAQDALKAKAPIPTHCFSYDAWLHQNDPPRRAFLETLIHFLIEEGLTTEKRWKPQLDKLNQRTEESETTSTPTLTPSGRAIAFSLLLWTIGLPLVGHDWYAAAIKKGATAVDVWPYIIGLCLLFLPFAIACSFYLSWRPVKSPLDGNFWRWKNFTAHKAPHENDSILSLIMNKEVQRQHNRTIRTPDPTTIEFQDIFREIMHEVKEVNGEKRRYLFVIDNLDRLPEAEAVAMWSTIRSFFLGAHETHHVRKAAELPTVILPIDEEAIRRIYSVSHPADANVLAKSFTDKTFDLTFRLSRPVLSNWNSYLAAQMKMVFGPAMPADWPYITGRLYEGALAGQQAPDVTPRSINTLINAIATLWLQWRTGGVSFAAVAYYAIFRVGIDSDILGAVRGPNSGIADLDPDWQRAIAALHYGASPDDAAQILIEQPLRNAIVAKDAKALAALSAIPSFDRVFMRLIDQFPNDGIDPQTMFATASMLQTLGNSDDLWKPHAWHRLVAAFGVTAQWRVFGPEDAEAVKTLISHCSAAELTRVLAGLNVKLESLDPGAVSVPAIVAPFVSVWSDALSAAQAAQIPIPSIRVPGEAGAFLSVAAACRDNPDLLKRLATKIDDDALVQELGACLSDQTRAGSAERKFLALLDLGRPFDWEALVVAAIGIVRDHSASHRGMPAALLVLGLLRTPDKNARSQTQSLVTGGQLPTRLNESLGQSLDMVTARALALLLLNNSPGFPTPDNAAWNKHLTDQPALPDSINDALLTFDGPDQFRLLTEAAKANPNLASVVRAVLSLRVENGELGKLHMQQIVADLPQYLALINQAMRENFMVKLSHYETFWDVLEKQPLEDATLILLRCLIKQQDSRGETAQKALREKLGGVSVAEWNTAIRKNDEPLLIADELAHVSQAPVALGSQLFDALSNLGPEILSNADVNLRANWFAAADHLNASARHTLLRNLRDAILGGSSVKQLSVLLTTGGSEFIERGGFAEKADESVRHVVLKLLEDADGIVWLSDHALVVGEWIKAADSETTEFLNVRLADGERTADSARLEQLKSLRGTWSLPAPMPAETTAADAGNIESGGTTAS